MEELAKQIHSGGWQEGNIPDKLYFSTAQKLAAAITQGMGESFGYDDPLNSLAAGLRANLYQFSGAKSLTHAAALSDALIDENGKLKPFSRYRKDVLATNKLYNEQYLSAEYSNAVAQSQMATKWKEFEALGPDTWIEYRTVGDDRVRPKHRAMDGIVQKIDSPFWDRAFPPNDWACRCTVIPADAPHSPMSAKEAGKIGKENVGNPVFENNTGKTGIVYKDDHPYFDSLKGIKELDAVANYGMKSLSSIMKKAEDFPAPLHMDTETDYYIWWKKMVTENGVNETDFVLQDKTGTSILFESRSGKKSADYFRDHILRKPGEKRHEYALNIQEVVTAPDEIWYKSVKGVKEWQYIKYYNDGPYLLTVLEKDGVIKAETFYKIEKGRFNDGEIRKKRTGVLLFKK